MGIVVIGAIFVDIKGFPKDAYVPDGRNAGRVEYVHGGVCRNVAEDIANIELRPTFVSIVDDTSMGDDVMKKLKNHKIDTRYIRTIPGGMGTWLAVFDNHGDLAGSISQRADLSPLLDVLDESGDEIFSRADSIVIQADLGKELIKKVFALAEKHQKKVYAVVANMTIATDQRHFLQKFACLVCNQLEAGILFAEDFSDKEPDELCEIISEKVMAGQIPALVVTMGSKGAVYADCHGDKGFVPARKVRVADTTGAGDAFFSGVVIGLTYGRELKESVEIGTKLAASVIVSTENVCPRFRPRELGLDIEVEDEV